MPKNHHIQNIMKKATKARLNPLENAQNSSYPKYYDMMIFGQFPKGLALLLEPI